MIQSPVKKQKKRAVNNRNYAVVPHVANWIISFKIQKFQTEKFERKNIFIIAVPLHIAAGIFLVNHANKGFEL